MKIAIVGAGLLGRVVALNLLKEGNHTITLFDKDSKEGITAAGFTAAGMLAPFAELETAESEIFEYGKRSIELWQPLLKEVGVYDGFGDQGTIITAHPQDVPELNHFIQTLQHKVEEAKEIKQLNSQQLTMLEPDLAQHQQAFYIQKEGVVDAQRFMAFSTNYFDMVSEVTWREFTPVKRLESSKVYLEDGSIERFDWVFDTRGLGAKEYFGDLRGVRGEVVWVESKEINITRPTRLLHPRYKIYIVPRGNGCEGIDLEYCKDCKIAQTPNAKRYIIGASEIESEDLSPISVRSSLELMSALFTVHPNFGEARIVNSETNCRPAFRDNLPRIENSDGITRINGLYRHGYLLAPAVVERALNEGIKKEQL
jgi:glycine oxidase